MLISINYLNFPIDVVQDREYCIPATLESILRYHDINTITLPSENGPPIHQLDQLLIYKILLRRTKGRSPSFEVAKDMVNEMLQGVKADVKYPDNFELWLSIIEQQINDGYPIAISTKLQNGYSHVRTGIGFDEEEKFLRLYNTGTQYKVEQKSNDFELGVKSTSSSKSEIEDYSYEDAESDWDKEGANRDLLIIRKNKIE